MQTQGTASFEKQPPPTLNEKATLCWKTPCEECSRIALPVRAMSGVTAERKDELPREKCDTYSCDDISPGLDQIDQDLSEAHK